MSPHLPIDQLLVTIHELDRDCCMAELLHFKHIKLDFTEKYLERMSTDRLRHVLMAACLQARKRRRR